MHFPEQRPGMGKQHAIQYHPASTSPPFSASHCLCALSIHCGQQMPKRLTFAQTAINTGLAPHFPLLRRHNYANLHHASQTNTLIHQHHDHKMKTASILLLLLIQGAACLPHPAEKNMPLKISSSPKALSRAAVMPMPIAVLERLRFKKCEPVEV